MDAKATEPDSALESRSVSTPASVPRQREMNQEPGILWSMISVLSGESAIPLLLHTPSADELDAIKEDGNFSIAPVSELFLQIYSNILKCPEYDVSSGQAQMKGATGRIPLTIISTVPDIADHYYKLIIEAKSDIMIFSNFWKTSYAARRIGDALRVLSDGLEQSKEPRVVVRIMFDRGSVGHLLYPRVAVREAEWITLGLPPAKEIPNLDLEVLNYHNFPLGTLHSKFMVVDKKIAVLNSCNIQDNSNLEMMCQFEGPIVDQIWDHGIATWGSSEPKVFSSSGNSSPFPSSPAKELYHVDSTSTDDPPVRRTAKDVSEVLNRSVTNPLPSDATDNDISEHPFRSHLRLKTDNFPMVLAPRAHYAGFRNLSLNTPQNVAWLSGVYFAKSKILIQTPDLNAPPVITALLEAVKRGLEVSIILCLGYNDLGEMLPTQGGQNENAVVQMKKALNDEERERLKIYWYVGRDMKRPVHALKQFRTCHIKLMIVDEKIGIVGSGNQDTQSWFHSQEINVVIDSQEVCKEWTEQLIGNQNSLLYGRGSDLDGIWEDSQGNRVPGSIGPKSGLGAWARGLAAFAQAKAWG